MTVSNTPTPPKKIETFADLIHEPVILKNLTEGMGFEVPTPIQTAVIPSILQGRHIFAGARTGSGKTVAFLAPLCQMLREGKIKKALVLCPVRELAMQIDEEAMKVLGPDQSECVSIPLYGGVPLDQQLRAMKIHKPRLYIATPGRMIDFMSEGEINLSEIDACVLDEADRMCDMGFTPQVREILSSLTACKQMLMFSATLPKEANELMNEFLVNPEKIQVDPPDEANSNIEHEAMFISRRDRLNILIDVLGGRGTSSSLIFSRTRKGADKLYSELNRARIRTGILHAGYTMSERERTIRDFREGKIQHLVATDVAARGIDVPEVGLVVHYELPESIDDYIHRSGRSGRAGRAGKSLLMLERESVPQRRALEELTKKIPIKVIGDSPRGASPRRTDSAPDESGDDRPRRQGQRQPGDSSGRQSSSSRGRSRNRNRSRREGGSEGGSENRDSSSSSSSGPRSGSRGPRSQGRGRRSDKRGASAKPAPAGKPEAKKGLLKKAKSLVGKLLGKKK